jgi:hypothetical protein
VRRSPEIEVERIANIQRQHLVPLLDDLVRNASQVADGIANVVEPLGGSDFVSLSSWSHESLAAARVPATAVSEYERNSTRRGVERAEKTDWSRFSAG